MNRIITLNLCAICLGQFAACGSYDLSTGSTASPNDATPSGTVVAQGQFFGQNGKSASGTASIYLSGASYILNLQGISVPFESGLLVQVQVSPTGNILNTTLRATSGNQNYNLTSVSYGATFNSVTIYSSITQTNYAVAQLTKTK